MLVEETNRRGRVVAGAILVAALLAATGCGTKMGQVDGTLVWADGTPAKELAGSQIVFESAETRTSARGTIGDDGRFRLGTKTTDDGAPVGEYQVALVEKRKSVTPESMLLQPPILDQKYGDFQTSGLKTTVKVGLTPVTLTVERAAKP